MQSENMLGAVHRGIEVMRQEVGEQVEAQTFDLLLRAALEPACSQMVLAERTDLSLSAVSRNVERLRKKELVLRTEDPEDRRNKVITLTAKGERLMERIESACYKPTPGKSYAG